MFILSFKIRYPITAKVWKVSKENDNEMLFEWDDKALSWIGATYLSIR